MEVSLSRLEKHLNDDNTIKEIFISVNIIDDGHSWSQGYWLTPTEVELGVDGDNLNLIMDKVALKAKENLYRFLSQPVEIYNDIVPRRLRDLDPLEEV